MPPYAVRRAKADSWAGQAQTRFWAAWAHVAYRVQYSRYLAFYCLICAGLGAALSCMAAALAGLEHGLGTTSLRCLGHATRAAFGATPQRTAQG